MKHRPDYKYKLDDYLRHINGTGLRLHPTSSIALIITLIGGFISMLFAIYAMASGFFISAAVILGALYYESFLHYPKADQNPLPRLEIERSPNGRPIITEEIHIALIHKTTPDFVQNTRQQNDYVELMFDPENHLIGIKIKKPVLPPDMTSYQKNHS